MKIRRTAMLASVLLVSSTILGIQAGVAQAGTPSDSISGTEDVYVLSVTAPTAELEIPALLDAASSSDLAIQTIAFSGESGVGQLEVVPGEPIVSVVARAAALFEDADTEVPPIVGATASSSSASVPGEIAAAGVSIEIQPVDESVALTPSLPTDQLSAHGNDSTPPAAARAVVPPATNDVVNDWPSYFPAEWRTEGHNLNRCTYYANGQCWSWAQRATLTQSVKWPGSGTSVPWSFSDWGFEYGVTLVNYAMCNTSTSYQGWWLGSNYSEWSTNVPSTAGPYVEGNRLFDDCQNMSHEVGIRDPQLLYTGYTYIFTVSAPRNSAQTSTTMSAAYQALHDDCLPGVALTDCMGLNTTIAWPYSTDQSETVVNSSRNFKLPGCARMYDSWTDPIRWSNGTSAYVPSPLAFWDSCFSNDYS